MSGTIGRMVSKIVIAFVLIALFLNFISMMQSEEENMVKDTVNSVLSEVPFAESTVEVICEFMKYSLDNIEIKSTRTLLEDLLRLLVMAVIQAPVIGFLTAWLLPMPKARNQILALHLKRYEDEEAYISQPGYKLKRLLLIVIVTPILSLLASWIIGVTAEWIETNFGGLYAVLIGGISVTTIFALSLPVLLAGHLTLQKAILWRLLVTLCPNMVRVYLIDTICLCIYVTVVKDALGWLLPEIIGLFFAILIIEGAIKLMQSAVAGW